MKQLALSDEILLEIEKPGRYLGIEVNHVMKENFQGTLFAMCFPDVYEIGMSHLGLQILYEQLNRREDVWCERVYAPWTDLEAKLREENIPLFTLESQRPLKEVDFLGFTLQYEMCYTNILQILDLAHIPFLQKDRAESDPLIIGGGPCAYNPEPISDFFDLFYIGEGEVVYDELLDLYAKYKKQGLSKREFLIKAAHIPGIYVPSLYEVIYDKQGLIQERISLEGAPDKIQRQAASSMEGLAYPDKPLVPLIRPIQDRVVLEIQRGCIRGCRFCQAGMVYRPTRERSLDYLKEQAIKMLDATGYDEISLSSLSSSDYSYLKELLSFLIEECGQRQVNISLPSLRIDSFSLDIMSQVQDIKKSSLTFAPEAGSQRMRDVINKGLSKEDIIGGATQAFAGGWNKVKLYFMLGLPLEEKEDVEDIANLAEELTEKYYEIPKAERNGKCQITISTSYFIPKPFTPFQWVGMDRPENYRKKVGWLRDQVDRCLNKKSIKYQWHETYLSVLEGILARGDRKVSALILKAYELGARFDSWSEHFKKHIWEEAIQATGITPDFYAHRQRELDEILPWEFIDVGVTKNFLKLEWKQSQEVKLTPNCKERCSRCGATVYQGGICFETKI